MLAKVYVTLKNGVLDPQGKAIHHAAETIGYQGITDVRQGKYFEVKLDPTLDVKGNVELGLKPIRVLLDRFNEVSAKFAEPMDDAAMEKLRSPPINGCAGTIAQDPGRNACTRAE